MVNSVTRNYFAKDNKMHIEVTQTHMSIIITKADGSQSTRSCVGHSMARFWHSSRIVEFDATSLTRQSFPRDV